MPLARFVRRRRPRKALKPLFLRAGAVVTLYPLLGLCALRPAPPTVPPTAIVQIAPSPLPPTLLPSACPTATRMPTPAPTPTRTPTEPPIPTPTVTQSPFPTPTVTESPSPTAIPRVLVPVARVIDGDTIKVVIDGAQYSVRYIGIDAPQLGDPERPTEWLALESREANRALVEGQVVGLESDITDLDQYGRLVRHVWVGDVLVTAELVRLGLARAVSSPPDIRYDALLLAAEEEARQAGRGLWGSQPTVAVDAGRDGCDPAYPDICIPPPPPDLNCGDIPYRRFRVLPPDPHHLDRDGDGVGCES